MFVTPHQMLEKARAARSAVGSFNVVNLETAQAVATAAERTNTPVMIQVYHEDLKHMPAAQTGALVRAIASNSSVDIALHLDHGHSLEQVRECIECGFTSVMIDASDLEFERNVEITRQVVELAASHGVFVEAALGHILDGTATLAERKLCFTIPGEVEEFVTRTQVNALAVAVGTAHGDLASGPTIDFDLLNDISSRSTAFLVMHGGSGIADADMTRLIAHGITKVNIGTSLMNAHVAGMRRMLDDSESCSLKAALTSARQSAVGLVTSKIGLFQCDGAASEVV